MTAPPTATMPCFTKYLEGLVKSVNVFFHEKTRSKEAPHPLGAMPSAQRKPSSTASSLSLMSSSRRASRKRNSLDVTCCTGRRIVGKESRMETPAAASASAPRLSVEEAAAGVFTEEDFRCPPTIAYPKAREGSLYSLLLVDLKGHNSLHARSHRLAWVQHNIPGAAFARGDISAGSVCTPYRPPCARRGSMHVLVLVFEQQRGATLRDVSPVFAEEGLRLSTWLSRFGSAARRMVVCEEFRAHVQRSANGGDSSDSDACSASSVELGPTTVSFHKLESPKRPKTAATAFVFSEQNGWVPVSASSLAERKGRPLDSPCVSPKHECAKRIKVF